MCKSHLWYSSPVITMEKYIPHSIFQLYYEKIKETWMCFSKGSNRNLRTKFCNFPWLTMTWKSTILAWIAASKPCQFKPEGCNSHKSGPQSISMTFHDFWRFFPPITFQKNSFFHEIPGFYMTFYSIYHSELCLQFC